MVRIVLSMVGRERGWMRAVIVWISDRGLWRGDVVLIAAAGSTRGSAQRPVGPHRARADRGSQ